MAISFEPKYFNNNIINCKNGSVNEPAKDPKSGSRKVASKIATSPITIKDTRGTIKRFDTKAIIGSRPK